MSFKYYKIEKSGLLHRYPTIAVKQSSENLYKATIKFCGLSRQVVFHDKEN